VFGLSAYVVTFCLYWFCSFWFSGISFQTFKFQKDVEFLDEQNLKLIFHASLVSFVCGFVWLYVRNRKLLERLLQRIRATKRDGDEDVWDNTFNSELSEVEYVHLRDFEKKLIYTGWVETFSGTEKLRELRLKGVVVYDFDGEMVFESPRVYLARKMDNIDIAFPVEEG